MLMTIAQEGAYHRLLQFAWLDPTCALPTHITELKQLAKWTETDEAFVPVRACLIPHPAQPDKLTNKRLYAEWLKAQRDATRLEARAVAGAAARWHPTVSHTLPHGNSRAYLREADEILTFLNEKTGRLFRGREANGKPSSNLDYIVARLKAGADLQTCKTLIARKVRDWKGDPKMMKFLRPETLFNRTKFESYLGEVQS